MNSFLFNSRTSEWCHSIAFNCIRFFLKSSFVIWSHSIIFNCWIKSTKLECGKIGNSCICYVLLLNAIIFEVLCPLLPIFFSSYWISINWTSCKLDMEGNLSCWSCSCRLWWESWITNSALWSILGGFIRWNLGI